MLFVKLLTLFTVFTVTFGGNLPWSDVASDASGKYLTAVASNTSYASQVFLSDDYGASWRSSNSMSAHWTTIYSDPSGKKLVAGSNCDPSGICPGAYYSLDRGNTWALCSGFPSKPFFYGSIAGDGTGTNLWTNEYIDLYHSANGGKNWAKITNLPYQYGPNAGYPVAADYVNTNVFAVSEGYIVTSNNGGATWTKRMKYAPTDGSWRNFVVDSTGKYVYAVSDYTFYHSTDYGVTWSSVKAYPHYDGRFGQLVTDSTGDNTYVIDSSTVYKYTRSTGTYQATSLTASGLVTIAGSSNCQYLIAGASNGNLYRSKDYGKSWTIAY